MTLPPTLWAVDLTPSLAAKLNAGTVVNWRSRGINSIVLETKVLGNTAVGKAAVLAVRGKLGVIVLDGSSGACHVALAGSPCTTSAGSASQALQLAVTRRHNTVVAVHLSAPGDLALLRSVRSTGARVLAIPTLRAHPSFPKGAWEQAVALTATTPSLGLAVRPSSTTPSADLAKFLLLLSSTSSAPAGVKPAALKTQAPLPPAAPAAPTTPPAAPGGGGGGANAGGGGGGFAAPGGGGGGAPPDTFVPAHEFVALTGSDSCTRDSTAVSYAAAVTAGAVCLTWDKAAAIASAGDVILIEGGSYSAQAITHSPGRTPITFEPDAASVRVDGISLGAYNSATSPGYITVNGLNQLTTTAFGDFYSGFGGGGPSHDALLNSIVKRPGTTSSQGALVFLLDSNNTTVQGNTIGPACCSSDGIGVEIRGGGDDIPTNINIVGNKIHDLYDTCAEWPTYLGSCTVPANQSYGSGSCSVGNCDHVDGMQVFGCRTCNISQNAIYMQGDSKQGIFLQVANGGAFSDITIANNMVNSLAGCGIILGGPGTGLWSGYAKILYNTVLGCFSLYDLLYVPGSPVTIAGNIFAGYAGNVSAGGCTMTYSDGSRLTPTWSKNLQGSTGPCTGDVGSLGAPTVVQAAFPGAGPCGTGVPTGCTTATGDPNLDLSGAQTAIHGGEATYCGAGTSVDADIHGRARPAGAVCDIGAYEAG